MPLTLERRVLSLIGELIGVLELDEFAHTLLYVLRAALPAEWCALNEVPADLPGTVSLTDPPVPVEIHETFARYAMQNPIAAHFIRTGEGRATRFSDLISRRELHELELYQQVYSPLNVEYQIAFTLPSTRERVLGVSLSRARRNFSARERDLLNLARPYLIELYRNALAFAERGNHRSGSTARLPLEQLQALGLSRRQAEVLRLIATGYATPDAASILGISPRTAQKHLEHCYRTLGVTSRSQASHAAWAASA